MLKEFRDFAVKGNVLDLAIGVIIGAAFGKVVSSLVADVIMPPIGLFLGKVDFSNLFVNLSSTHYASLADARKAGAPTLNYGVFLNQIIEFLIVAFSVFLMVKGIHRMKALDAAFSVGPASSAPQTRSCPYCLSSIPSAATRCAFCTTQLES